MSKETSLNKNHKLYIISLNINDCLGCDTVHVEFSRTDNVHVIAYEIDKDFSYDLSAITPVAQAIQLLCTLTFPDGESLSKIPQLNIGRGSVSLNFEMASLSKVEEVVSDLDETPCTSRQAEERHRRRMKRKKEESMRILQPEVIQVTVMRRFDDLNFLDLVSYTIDEGQTEILTISEFHERFFLRPQHSDNFLKDLHQRCAGNWLKLIRRETSGDPFTSYKEPESPFDTFVKLFCSQENEPQPLLCNLATTCVEVDDATRLAERRFVLEVFDQVRQIFEYITFDEYSVWFLVPHPNNIEQVDPVTLDDFDLTKVRTSIRFAGDTRNVYWDYTNHNIKDLLFVAFQLALATNVNQSVLVISHLKTLSEFLTLQYMTAHFMNDCDDQQPSDSKWISHRYLQRIVETALFMGTIVIIEYPSSFTLLDEGRQLIKCFPNHFMGSSDALEWDIFEDVVKNNESNLDFLKEATNQISM
ncbi:protein ORD [Drosophila rhopaloa]|uniref:Protein ORD n=1 Tax=Drosophila rhopaloa TaxID=1041015 RepID=A0A6P4E3Q9_DRORH|nr:protein ORD [Drosophila rhopaloa]